MVLSLVKVSADIEIYSRKRCISHDPGSSLQYFYLNHTINLRQDGGTV